MSPETVTGLTVPVPAIPPGLHVAVYPLIVAPPLLEGAVKATDAEPLPGVAVPATGASGFVAYDSTEGFVSPPSFEGVSVTGPGEAGVIVKVCAAADPLNVSTTAVDNPPPEGVMGEMPDGEPFIVPMAIPLIAGPSGMAAVMLLGSQQPGRMGDWMMALTIAWAATAAILFSATYLKKWLGIRVLTAIERLMGMVIVAISVQMLLDGISSYLHA